MHTVFISDLHLSPQQPEIVAAFVQFLTDGAAQAERVYILGDLFEYWIGDDAADLVEATPVLHQMRKLADRVPSFFIAGNRDFLVGPDFSAATGFEILPDETVVDLYGRPTLLLHGDSLCIEDHAHQSFRREIVTNQGWRENFLQLSIPERVAAAQQARMQSNQHKSQVSMEIMDVTESAVLDTFLKYEVTQMIHGHTHRQAIHNYTTDAGAAQRYVLGDWSSSASVLRADAKGLELFNFPI